MATQPRSLYGTVVAITGGARGIGRATANALAREGAKVAIGDLDADLAAKEAAAIGGDAVGLGLDVTDRDSFEAFLDAVEEKLGPLDVLVNNAGIMPLGRFIEEDDASTIRQMIPANPPFRAPARTTLPPGARTLVYVDSERLPATSKNKSYRSARFAKSSFR